METLEKIFGGGHKVKIMRLFLFNPQTAFDAKDIAGRAKVASDKTRREIANLEKIGMIKGKTFTKELKSARKKEKARKKRVRGWVLNPDFPYLKPLQNFLVHISATQQKEIVKKLKKVGSLKLLVLSGVFIQDWESRADLLIVGDKLSRASLENAISGIESEVGKEINYCSFETRDFLYRLGVCDKLVRDILDYPHKKAVNKIDLD